MGSGNPNVLKGRMIQSITKMYADVIPQLQKVGRCWKYNY